MLKTSKALIVLESSIDATSDNEFGEGDSNGNEINCQTHLSPKNLPERVI